jgi:ribokinase
VTVLVVGNVVVDRAYRCRDLPATGASVLAERGPCEPGGKGFNQAVAAARSGAAVRLVAAVGADPAGGRLRASLTDEGIDDGTVRVTPATDESLVFVDDAGANAIVSTAAAARALPAAAVATAIDATPAGGWLLLQGNLTPTLTAAAVRRARTRGLRVAFNPSPVDAAFAPLLAEVDLAVLNAVEAAVFDATAARATVVTRGAGGAVWRAGGRAETVAAPAVPAVDTVGAGDVLAGVLVGRLARGDAPAVALSRAVRAATLKVQRRGTYGALPTAAEIAALEP